jgi:hypothetical protein
LGSGINFRPTNQQALIRSESRFVETAFWSGVAGGQTVVFPHLAADSEFSDGEDLLQPVGNGRNDVHAAGRTVGIGMLEDAIRDCYPGMSRRFTCRFALQVNSSAEANLIAPRFGVMLTRSIGSKVVIGDYPGTAPDGTSTAGVTWIYATGEVFFARDREPSGFRPADSFDRECEHGRDDRRAYVRARVGLLSVRDPDSERRTECSATACQDTSAMLGVLGGLD